MKSQRGRISSAAVFIVVVLVLGAALGAAGFWYGKKNAGKQNQSPVGVAELRDESKAKTAQDDKDSPTPAELNSCPSSVDPKTYYNKVIGLEFCYPKEWGEATVGAPEASASVAGSAYEIHFSSKEGIAVSASTTDYQNTIGRDGRCEDPTSTPPNFSQYSTTWIKDSADSELTAAARYHIKKDDVYLIAEDVNSFFWGICYRALINQTGTAYPVVKVALRRSLGATTVFEHISSPTILVTPEERVQFGELVDSVRKPL